MKENKVFRKDGELRVQFTIDKKASMLEMEEQIASLLDSIEGEVTKLEKLRIKEQLLNALKEEI